MDNEHWQYRFREPQRKEHLYIDSIFAQYGCKDRDILRLFSDRVQIRKLDRIPGRLVGMHQKMLEIEKEIESRDLRYVLRGIANQFLGIGIAKLAKTISVSQQDIQKHIEKLNQEVLAEHDLKIHMRNGIAIIGGTDEAEPIFVIDLPETREKFFSQDEDAATLFSGNTVTGPEPKSELLQKTRELQEQIRILSKQNTELKLEIQKWKAELEEAKKQKQLAAALKITPKPPAEPPKPRPPNESSKEIKGNGYQLTTTERLKDAAIEIAEFLAHRKFPLNNIPGKPLQLHLEIAEKKGKIMVKSNIQNFASNCAIYKERMVIALSKILNVETVAVELINF